VAQTGSLVSGADRIFCLADWKKPHLKLFVITVTLFASLFSFHA
jgi:hypothetical protein